MFNNVKADLQRHLCCDRRQNNSFIWKLFIIAFAYGFQASTTYRYAHFIDRHLKNKAVFYPVYLVANSFYFVGKFFTEKMYGISIDRRADIGEGLYIGHFGGISIGNCRIGKNCNVHQQVKIGDGCVLGNNIWIGAHAVIETGVKISSQATIMVGARVSSSVCTRCLASGSPARIINKDYDNTALLGLKPPD